MKKGNIYKDTLKNTHFRIEGRGEYFVPNFITYDLEENYKAGIGAYLLKSGLMDGTYIDVTNYYNTPLYRLLSGIK